MPSPARLIRRTTSRAVWTAVDLGWTSVVCCVVMVAVPYGASVWPTAVGVGLTVKTDGAVQIHRSLGGAIYELGQLVATCQA